MEKAEQLIFAIKNEETEKAKQLINEGIDINSIIPSSNWSFLNYAIENNNLEIVKHLLEAGADINLMGEWPATHHAAESASDSYLQLRQNEPDTQILEYLLSHDPDLTLKDSYGKTPMDYADHPKMKKLLAR